MKRYIRVTLDIITDADTPEQWRKSVIDALKPEGIVVFNSSAKEILCSRMPRPLIPTNVRGVVVGQRKTGETYTSIAKMSYLSRSSVIRICREAGVRVVAAPPVVPPPAAQSDHDRMKSHVLSLCKDGESLESIIRDTGFSEAEVFRICDEAGVELPPPE